MKRVLFLLMAVATMGCYAQTEVSSFFTGAAEGVTYSLPDTRIEITLKATCIKQIPGEFSRYAERYLRVKNAIEKAESYWELDGVSIGKKGVPSPDKMFTIRLNGSTASNITLDAQGVIATINTALPVPAEEEYNGAHNSGTRLDAGMYMTEEMLQATSTAKMAELTAKEIYAIRESKLAITRGQAENMPNDGQAMQLVLNELEKQERALLELFIGRTDTIRQEIRVELEPSIDCNISKAVLLRFSRKLGFVEKDNLAGEPVYYSLRDLKSVKRPTPEEEAKRKPVKKEGICYNIPGKAEVEVFTRTRKLLKEEVAVAQLGTTEVLSKTLFNKNNATKVVFDTATGGIISIEKK
ncbi:MAG: DUF4831 family protein [Bacteroidaceae bacterium]|nr:DUF4831 family protein [Bacteroidaceae bacterium]